MSFVETRRGIVAKYIAEFCAFSGPSAPILLGLLLAQLAFSALLSVLGSSFDSLTLWSTLACFSAPLLIGGLQGVASINKLEHSIGVADKKRQIVTRLRAQKAPADAQSVHQLRATESDKWRGGSYSVSARLIERAAQAGAQLRFDPVASLIALELTSIRSGSSTVKTWQNTAIRFGILGTFIGLALGLPKIPSMLRDVETETMTRLVSGLVQDLALAFGTSIAGLLAAIALQIESFALAQREMRLLADIDAVLIDVQSFYIDAHDHQPLIRTVEGLRRTLESHKSTLYDSTLGIRSAAEEVNMAVAQQELRFKEHIDSFSAQGNSISRLAEQQTLHIEKIQSVYTALGSVDGKLHEVIVASVHSATSALAAAQDGQTQRLQSMYRELQQLEEKFRTAIATASANSAHSHAHAIDQFRETIQSAAAEVTSAVKNNLNAEAQSQLKYAAETHFRQATEIASGTAARVASDSGQAIQKAAEVYASASRETLPILRQISATLAREAALSSRRRTIALWIIMVIIIVYCGHLYYPTIGRELLIRFH